MGNNQSKLRPLIYLTPSEQKVLANTKYLDRHIFKASSVKRNLERIAKEIVLTT